MIITLLTDFGTSDYYVAAMKGVILSHAPGITIVDITHEIPAHDVAAAAFVLAACHADFPAGTVHVVVVDPGVGSERFPVAFHTADQTFVGPDNGVFAEVVRAHPPGKAYRIDPGRFGSERKSKTFHGRDVFAPAAARLATGLPLNEVGPSIDDLREVGQAPVLSGDDGAITGRIVHIDRFGNCVSNLRPEDFRSGDWRGWYFEVGGALVRQSREFYADGEGQGPFAILGSSGRIEISMNQNSAADMLDVHAGDPIRAVPLLRSDSRRG